MLLTTVDKTILPKKDIVFVKEIEKIKGLKVKNMHNFVRNRKGVKIMLTFCDFCCSLMFFDTHLIKKSNLIYSTMFILKIFGSSHKNS
jgi:hypothetical protein